MKSSHLKLAALFAASGLFLAACAPTESAETPDAALPQIVVTTNVWADVASQIAGDKFEVVALISDPAQDPHSYEATARDQLAVSQSSLFVVNGGGYDDFALQLASAAGVEAFNIYELHEAKHAHEGEESHEHEGEEGHEHEGEEGHEHEGEEGHEHEGEEGHEHEGEEGHEHEGEKGHEHSHDGSDHIWYDLHIAEFFASKLAEKLAELDSANSQYFLDNASAFKEEIEALEARVSALSTSRLHYFEAHPLATLLLKELQFEDLTPKGFAEAEEAEVEPSAAILKASREVITSGKLDFLAVNEQVTSPTLESLKALAEEQGIPVLTFDELLPKGKNFQTWFSDILTKLEDLL
jgi:zinc/manganese transport system substrate-binding protein